MGEVQGVVHIAMRNYSPQPLMELSVSELIAMKSLWLFARPEAHRAVLQVALPTVCVVLKTSGAEDAFGVSAWCGVLSMAEVQLCVVP